MKKPTSPPSRQKKNRKKVVAVTSQEIPRSGPQRAAAGKGTSLLQSLAHLSLPKVKKILRARAEQLLAEAASIDLELDKHIVLSESQLSCSTENFWVRITQVSGALKIESSTGIEEELARQSRSRLAAGQMLGASLHFLGSLAPIPPSPPSPKLSKNNSKPAAASTPMAASPSISNSPTPPPSRPWRKTSPPSWPDSAKLERFSG